MYLLPETELVKFKIETLTKTEGKFVIEPLSPGYGVTLGNSLRRILISSLEGAAITSVKIEGVKHEFSVVPGVREEVIGILLNLKSLRFKVHRDEPITLALAAKGPKVVTGRDFKPNPDVEIITPDGYLATLSGKTTLNLQVVLEKGRGYVPTEHRGQQKLPIGTIAIDSIFTPVKKAHYEVENTRVGGMTNFDKLIFDITTDGTISPLQALKQGSQILTEHLQIIVSFPEPTAKRVKPPLKAKKITLKKVTKVEATKKAKATSKQ